MKTPYRLFRSAYQELSHEGIHEGMNIYRNFDFDLLNSPDFKEDSVREEIIQPLLKELGYSASSENRIIRSKNLLHPVVSIGSRTRKITLVPDYLLQVHGRNAWVLDAKAPHEKINTGRNVEQVYSYAIHPKVRVKLYGLCNGKEIVIFDIEQEEPVLSVFLTDLHKRQHELVWLLAPQAFVNKPVVDIDKAKQGMLLPQADIGSYVEKEIGVLWSHLANEPVHKEIIRFKGQLLAKASTQDINGPKWYELFRLPNGKFVVYMEYNHRFDYGGANLVGVNAWGEFDPPLTLEELQQRYPTLATQAGLARIREFTVEN